MPNPDRAHLTTPAHSSSPAPRSCYRCKERKVRCDKKTPCSPCRRGGASCVYPPPGPRIRRSKKTMMAEMASRISSLEASAASTHGSGAEAGPREDWAPTNTVDGTSSGQQRPPPRDKSRGGVLLRSGSSSQYFNEIFLSRVIKNVCFPFPPSPSLLNMSNNRSETSNPSSQPHRPCHRNHGSRRPSRRRASSPPPTSRYNPPVCIPHSDSPCASGTSTSATRRAVTASS